MGYIAKIESMSNVAWVRVSLHDDTQIEKDVEKEILTLAGDSIILCTNMQGQAAFIGKGAERYFRTYRGEIA